MDLSWQKQCEQIMSMMITWWSHNDIDNDDKIDDIDHNDDDNIDLSLHGSILAKTVWADYVNDDNMMIT